VTIIGLGLYYFSRNGEKEDISESTKKVKRKNLSQSQRNVKSNTPTITRSESVRSGGNENPVKLLFSRVESKFKMPLEKFSSISTDFPRLFQFISVYDGDLHELWEASPSHKTNESLKKFLLLLAELTQSKKNEDFINEKFSELFTNEKELNQQVDFVSTFPLILEGLGEQSVACGIFKCIHQGILVPPVTALNNIFLATKMNICEVRGKWKINIQIDDLVKISHERWERSVPELFNFKWIYTISISRNEPVYLVQTDFYISEIEFKDEAKQEKREEIMNCIEDVWRPSIKLIM